jgi:PAS domain S-box-containing protein
MDNRLPLHLKHLIAHPHDGILIADENGVVIVWNPALEQITGIPHRDAVGTPLTSLFTHLTAANDEVWNPALVDALGGANVTPEFVERQIERPNHELRTIQLATFTTATRHGCQTTSIVRDITARRNADITLQTLLRAIDQSPTTVLITDGEGRIEYANPRLTTLTGYTLEEVRGQTPRIFQSGYTKIEVYEQLWDTVKRGHEWHGELLNKKKNGELYWEAIHISPIIDEAGAITHFLAIKEDVTARKRAEEALARSEYTLKRSQRIAHIGDWTWDIQTNTVTWSDEMFRIFNVDPTTFTGDLNAIIESAIHPDDRASLLTTNQAVVNDQKPASLEYRVIWPDGSVRYIWAQPGEASFDERGNILYLSGIVQDITERKLNEFALRESEVRFRTLVASMDDIVFTLDKEQRHTGLYGRWLEKYQLPAEVFLGKTSREMLDAQTAEMHEAANQRVLNGEIVIYEWSDGRSHVQTSLTPLLDEQGQVSGIVGVGRDITEQKRAELELQRAHKELAQLHEDVSHQNQSLEQQVQQRTAELLHVNEQLSAIVNNISDGIVLLNTDDVIENTNPAFDNMFGYRRHEMYGRHYSEMVTADFEQTVAAALAKVRASGSVQRSST